jgi:hypothetical protein
MISLDLTVFTSTSSTIIDSAIDSYTLNGITYTASGSYLQNLINTNGCDSLLNLNLTMSFTGIDEWATRDLAVYPNPSNGNLLIVWDKALTTVHHLYLQDNNGRLIKDLSTDSQQYDLSTLVNGVYFIKVISNQGISYMKWVKY